MDWEQESLAAFRLKMAFLMPEERLARSLAEDTGLDPRFLDLSGSPVERWYAILSEARKQTGVLEKVVENALKRFPNDPVLQQLTLGKPMRSLESPVVNWLGEDGYEKIIGPQSTLVPVWFLEVGLERARAVARVGTDGGYGTGFLIGANLLLTNNHVLPTAKSVANGFADFDFQTAPNGTPRQKQSFKLDPTLFVTSTEHDWTVVGLEGEPGSVYGWIPLMNVSVEKGEYVQIIQHPSGGEKQLSSRSNIVAYADQTRVQYLTDTLPGSSGSPVFNRHWQVIALHHAGGNYPVPGSPKSSYLCNQGININQVISDLATQGILPGG